MRNLVVLRYSQNVYCVDVVSIDQALKEDTNLSLSDNNKTWKYDKHDHFNKGEFLVGKETRICQHGCRYGVIGIYNTDEARDLNRMISAAKEAVKSDSFSFDDDG